MHYSYTLSQTQVNPDWKVFRCCAAHLRQYYGGLAGRTDGLEYFFLLCAALAVPGMLLLLKVAPWGETERVS
jgi:hypothetical protein